MNLAGRHHAVLRDPNIVLKLKGLGLQVASIQPRIAAEKPRINKVKSPGGSKE